MCGIIGYTGTAEAAPILLDGLSRLEYRGYDSAGLAVQETPSPSKSKGITPIAVAKARGRLSALKAMTSEGRDLTGHCGIGHTRWATHGAPSSANAHPHLSTDGGIAVVHNGIIENHAELRRRLMSEGYAFHSETDTEVIVHLLDEAYNKSGTRSASEAIARAVASLRGTFALGILFADQPDVIYAIRHDSPLVVGCVYGGDGHMREGYLASDVPALLPHTRQVYYPNDMELVRLTPHALQFYAVDANGELTDVTHTHAAPETVAWNATDARLGGYEHFMMKEIHEQPDALRDTLQPRLRDGKIDLSDAGLDDAWLRSIRRIRMVACGSAYHACMVGKHVTEALCRIPVDTDIASEFRYGHPIIEDPAHTLTVVVSQSGETADTLAALRLAKALGMRVLAILNVVGSTMAREADHVLYTHAGPEIAVATTKAYSAQLAALYLLAIHMGYVQGSIDPSHYTQLTGELLALPDKLHLLLKDKKRIRACAYDHAKARDIFFIGRGLDYALSLEGSLKLKEISYLHSEAYAAGELKHGTISLIEEGTPVVAIATQPQLHSKMLSNMIEVKSRGAILLTLFPEGQEDTAAVSDMGIPLPCTDPLLSPFTAILPLQLFAYYVGCARHLDVDKPRNLAKSVTVE